MLLDAESSALVLIDFQEKLMPAIHDGDVVISQAVRLANIARILDVPVIGTEQSPSAIGPNVEPIRRLCSETVVKTTFNACAGGLAGRLPVGRRNIVVAGCEAHVCLLQTAFGLLAHDFRVWIVTDAAGSRRRSDRDAAFDRLARQGAHLVTVEMVAFEWLGDSTHPRFREILALIR